jgi:hypothetical protein
MLVPKQLTDRLLDNARTITKESLEIRHICRNTMSVSQLLRGLLQEERNSRSQNCLAPSSIQTIRRRARHDNAPKLVSTSAGFIRAQGLDFVR